MNLRTIHPNPWSLILVILFAFFFPLSGLADSAGSRTISGQVVSQATKEPIIGAVVIVPGTSVGTNTDADGNYKIIVPATAKALKFSYLGMAARTIAITDANMGTFKL